MPRFITPPRRVSSATDTRPRLPAAPGPRPAVISRADTIAELRAIYAAVKAHQREYALNKITALGRNLQA